MSNVPAAVGNRQRPGRPDLNDKLIRSALSEYWRDEGSFAFGLSGNRALNPGRRGAAACFRHNRVQGRPPPSARVTKMWRLSPCPAATATAQCAELSHRDPRSQSARGRRILPRLGCSRAIGTAAALPGEISVPRPERTSVNHIVAPLRPSPR
ncbi:hypothetical protein SKAU_G00363770 [Synaphobranchus kaupii]|uniref:Uncharacterized protein n=1 Tax=Synaphobranchus kaupii TaxID=118154 RepID=A0A9Q1EIR8_SYNKA|nr:hypothetical protein SKAU_G00363770 [Synaphobranchus kaupii]